MTTIDKLVHEAAAMLAECYPVTVADVRRVVESAIEVERNRCADIAKGKADDALVALEKYGLEEIRRAQHEGAFEAATKIDDEIRRT